MGTKLTGSGQGADRDGGQGDTERRGDDSYARYQKRVGDSPAVNGLGRSLREKGGADKDTPYQPPDKAGRKAR
jgi:hypothetical protein